MVEFSRKENRIRLSRAAIRPESPLILDSFGSRADMPADRTIPHFLTCPHRGHGLFCGLKRTDLLTLQREKVIKHYKRGQAIFYEGTPAAAIHCIYSGTVKLYKVGRDDQRPA